MWDILKQWAEAFFLLSFFHISPCPFPSGFDHRLSFVCTSLSIFDQCLSLISMFLSFLLSPVHDYYISPFFFFFWRYFLPSSRSAFLFHCNRSLSKTGYQVWTISEVTTVLSRSISCQIARWVSTIGASDQNEFTRMLGKFRWKAGGPWLRMGLCNQRFKKIIFK